jgi:hypothetical protein
MCIAFDAKYNIKINCFTPLKHGMGRGVWTRKPLLFQCTKTCTEGKKISQVFRGTFIWIIAIQIKQSNEV